MIADKVVAKRVQKTNAFHPLQYSSRPHCNGIDSLMCTVSTAKRALAAGEQATLLGKDVVAAFNHLRKEGLMQSLEKTDLEANFIGYIQDFLNPRSFEMAWEGQTRGRAQMDQGTPQGSPLSPAL